MKIFTDSLVFFELKSWRVSFSSEVAFFASYFKNPLFATLHYTSMYHLISDIGTSTAFLISGDFLDKFVHNKKTSIHIQMLKVIFIHVILLLYNTVSCKGVFKWVLNLSVVVFSERFKGVDAIVFFYQIFFYFYLII